MAKRTTQLLAQLKQLSQDAKVNMYERVKLVAEIIKDTDWIATTYDGDEDKALAALHQEHFEPTGCQIRLAKLVAIYRAFPNEQTWKRHKYNLVRLNAEYDEQRSREHEDRAAPRTSYKELSTELQERVHTLGLQHKRDGELISNRDSTIETLQERIRHLEDELDQLRQENAVFQGRISELERFAHQPTTTL